MNDDAIALGLEVRNCLDGYAYPERSRNPSECEDLADELGNERGYHPAVISIAKMKTMVVLCHSPVEAGDPRACGGPRRQPASPPRLRRHLLNPDAPRAAGTQFPALLETCREALSVRRRSSISPSQCHRYAPKSPWGIYTDAEDPLTGETVSASINVWGHVTCSVSPWSTRCAISRVN